VWKHHIISEGARIRTESDGTINTDLIPVVYYDLRFGNKCNLKCRSCGATDSNAWYGDQVKVWGDTYFDTAGDMKIIKVDGKYQLENDIYKWYENEGFWNNLNNEIPNIQHVYMVGGEPLLIKQQFDFLRKCIELGHADKIAIEYNSNIVNIPDISWDLWKNFRVIKVGASIDGVDKVNDYIRYPSRWKTIERNLKKLDKAEGNFELWLAITVQAMNILHLPEIFRWKAEQKFKRVNNTPWQPIASLHPLHSPDFLSAQVFPTEVKVAIAEKLVGAQFNENGEEAKALLDQYVSFMFQEDYSHRYYKFWEYTNKLDEIRDQKLQDYIPDLYELIGE
jgi:sulfatase maturation enzyme AslB (radical SAM superfamily)